MNTTGATAWDFLIAMRIPIWIIIILIVIAFCISKAENLLSLSGAIAGLFRNVSKSANKKQISASIRSSVISASKKIGTKNTGILPGDLKIKWADNDDISSFFDDGCVVVRLKRNSDPNENYVNIIYQFVRSGLLKNQKHYFDASIMNASTLLVSQKIVAMSKPSANTYFLESIYNPVIEHDEDVSDKFKQLQQIDGNGMLFNIYLNELLKAAAIIDGQIPDPSLVAESGELLRFLHSIAGRTGNELVDLNFKGIHFKIGIILAASNETLNKMGWSSHVRRSKKLLEEGHNTIYVFGIGRKERVATQIAYTIKNSEVRIVKSITHKYRHINASSGIRTSATCIELDTY